MQSALLLAVVLVVWGAVSRVSGGVATYRRVNQHYDVPDLRYEARGRVERDFRSCCRQNSRLTGFMNGSWSAGR